MNPKHRLSIILLLGVLFAACFLPGCSKTPEDHARTAKSGDSYEKRAASVEALAEADNQALLADVAANAANTDTRVAAARKLTDPQMLANLARDADAWTSAVAVAMEKINDPQTLADLAEKARHNRVRTEAALALGDDQTLLAQLAQNSPEDDIRRKAVEKLSDQAALAHVVKNDRNWQIRKIAVSRLTDQRMLVEIIQNEKRLSEIVNAALDRLDDQHQHIFAEAAINYYGDEKTRMAALRRLSDQKLLAGIAKTRDMAKERLGKRVFGERSSPEEMLAQARKDSANKAVAAAALAKITDQEILADIARSAGYDDLSRGALEKITDQKLLGDLARIKISLGDDVSRRGADSFIIGRALAKITGQEILADVAIHAGEADISKSALEKVSDQKALARVVQSAETRDYIRLAALDRLDDQRVLADIAANGRDDSLVWKSMDKLSSNQPALAGFARGGRVEIRLLAVWRLDERELLADIAKSDADERVRNAASAKLAGRLQPDAPEEVMDLLRDGKLLVEIRGREDITFLDLSFRKTVPWALKVSVPAGTSCVCQNRAVRDMVSTRGANFVLEDAWSRHGISVASAGHGKRAPGDGDSFVFARLPDNSDLKKLLLFLDDEDKENIISFPSVQAAVWIVSDNASYRDLHSLVLETRGGGNIDTRRMIYGPEAARAMRLCSKAGIDVRVKRIWHNRAEILAELEPGELKDWLENFK